MGTKKKKNNANDDAVVIPLDIEDEIEEYEKAAAASGGRLRFASPIVGLCPGRFGPDLSLRPRAVRLLCA